MPDLSHADLNIFGLAVWGGTIDAPHSPHRHNEIELNVIERGYITYSLAGRQVTIHEGETALFWGAIPHQAIDRAEVTEVHWGTIPLEYLLRWELPRDFLLALLSGALFHSQQALYTPAFFRQWHADIEAGRESMALMEIRALTHRFALDTTGQEHARTPTEHNGERANQMALFMSHHFQSPITVVEIAASVSLHPNYAMSIFKATFGIRMTEYLRQQRVAHAQQLLIMTDMPIAVVALESGFQTLSHFYSSFKALCGVSAGKYRATLRA